VTVAVRRYCQTCFSTEPRLSGTLETEPPHVSARPAWLSGSRGRYFQPSGRLQWTGRFDRI